MKRYKASNRTSMCALLSVFIGSRIEIIIPQLLVSIFCLREELID